MAAKNKQPVQIAITATLNPGAYEFLEKNAKNSDISGTLANWVVFWTDAQARGGLLLTPEDHQYLADLSDGQRFRNSKELVEAVAKGMKREDGQYTFPVSLDPAFVGPLMNYAESQGITLEQLVTDATLTIWASGWIYQLTPSDGRMIPFTKDMLDKAAEICGKSGISSADIDGMLTDGRFVPFNAADVREVARLAEKNVGSLDSGDYMALFAELDSLRAENKKLRERDPVAA